MFIFILLAVLCAKIKVYRLMPILKAYSLYPYAVIEVFYLFLQFNILIGNYSYVQFSSIINMVYLYTLLIPIVVYKLYKPGIYGSIFICVGTILNKFVISQNGGKMPVFASLSKLTGYYDESAIQTVDNIHIIGNEMTKFKFLSDFIDIGFSILSIGDILIHSFVFIIIYSVIKEVNQGIEYSKDDRKGFFIWRRLK
jgi:hypothetical protein